jgi:phosphatidylglycerophosphate synthase
MDGRLLDGIGAACLGAVCGEVPCAAIAAAQAGPDRRWKWRLPAQMERETGALTAPAAPAGPRRRRSVAWSSISASAATSAATRRQAATVSVTFSPSSPIRRPGRDPPPCPLPAHRGRLGRRRHGRRRGGSAMLDRLMRSAIDPTLDRWGTRLALAGWTADAITLIGLGLGLLAALAIALGAPGLALAPLLGSRLADGLDGAVARATRRTDFGGYLDIAADFLFYGAVPFGFVVMDPAANGVAGAFLLLTFYVNGTTFLGFAILAEKRGMETSARGVKSLYFTGGLLEGTETIAFFVLLCLWPGAFAPLAWSFGAACLVTAGARVLLARGVFPPGP